MQARLVGDHFVVILFSIRRALDFGSVKTSGPAGRRPGGTAEHPVGLRYGAIAHDPACASALCELADDLDRRGIRLAVVFAPVHPE